MKSNLKVNGQYIKDLSFENPNAPKIFFDISKTPPNIELSISVTSAELSSEEDSPNRYYETTLHITAKGIVNEKAAFICDLQYCGIFLIENYKSSKEEDLKISLYVNAPSIIFPFAREIISRMTVNAGFPPLMLDLIDFQKIYDRENTQQDK